ncbi:MAG TPA: collagen-binding domain-containing protein, partial [Candidatus Dormibacteraeota bacterium]|nr:collagen-binding domain-containing protein [Candidatus Dormibacteraeota bacterium]
VLVTATGQSGNTASTHTLVDGTFHIDLPEITQSYTLTIQVDSPLSPLCPASGQLTFFLDANVDSGHVTGQDFAVTGCTSPPPPGCPNCVDPNLGLGAAAGCTVLELGAAKVSITGPAGGILGDVCIAPNGSLAISGDEFITGTVHLGAGAKFANSSHSTVFVAQNVDLSPEISAAYAAAANAAAMPCTQTYTKLDGNGVTTITGVAGVNVICVGDVVLSGKQITLTGPAGAQFILNVTGKFVLTGGGAGPQIRVAGGVQSKDVLYNIIGTGADVAFSGGGGGVNCCAAIVDGTLLAPGRKINLSPGLVNGQVISGKDINIVSGSSVRCPPCP